MAYHKHTALIEEQSVSSYFPCILYNSSEKKIVSLHNNLFNAVDSWKDQANLVSQIKNNFPDFELPVFEVYKWSKTFQSWIIKRSMLGVGILDLETPFLCIEELEDCNI
jgi:hypothetical protein